MYSGQKEQMRTKENMYCSRVDNWRERGECTTRVDEWKGREARIARRMGLGIYTVYSRSS